MILRVAVEDRIATNHPNLLQAIRIWTARFPRTTEAIAHLVRIEGMMAGVAYDSIARLAQFSSPSETLAFPW